MAKMWSAATTAERMEGQSERMERMEDLARRSNPGHEDLIYDG